MFGRREIIGLLAGVAGAVNVPARAALGYGNGLNAYPCRHGIKAFDAAPASFLALYADNREQGRPNLVTEAFLIQMLSLSLRRAQREFEKTVLLPLLVDWQAAVLAALDGKAQDAMAGQAMAVFGSLLTGAQPANRRAEADVRLALAADGIERSNVLGVRLDFSQCRPRGHYADDPALSRMFRAMRYAGLAPFLLNASPATGVDQGMAKAFAAAALTLSAAMRSAAVRPLTERLDGMLAAAFGPAEDLSSADLPAQPATAEALRDQWLTESAKRLPAVIDVVMDNRKLGALTPAQAAISWRILPGRRLSDVAAMQQLVTPHVGAPIGPEAAAAFAAGSVDGQLVRAYVGFDDVRLLYGLSPAPGDAAFAFADMTAGARLAWAEAGRPALPSDNLRRFLLKTGPGASASRIDALLGLYVHHRHGLAMVAKQSMTSTPKGLVLAPPRPGAVLATDLVFIEALAELARGHASRFPAESWAVWQEHLQQLAEIAFRRSHICGGDADDRLLNNLDLALAALIDPGDDAPLTVDIHTVPSERNAVQIGIGRPAPIVAGSAVGANFALYQWKQPMQSRMNDVEFAVWLAGNAAAAAASYSAQDRF